MHKQGGKRLTLEEMKTLALEAGIPSFKVMLDAPEDKGRWIEIHKHVQSLGIDG